MTSSSMARFSELQLTLEPEHGELVRAFVREAALAESCLLYTSDAADE